MPKISTADRHTKLILFSSYFGLDNCAIAQIRQMANDCINKKEFRKKLGLDENFYKDLKKCFDDKNMLNERTDIAHADLQVCIAWLEQRKRVEKDFFPPKLENLIHSIKKLIDLQIESQAQPKPKKTETTSSKKRKFTKE